MFPFPREVKTYKREEEYKFSSDYPKQLILAVSRRLWRSTLTDKTVALSCKLFPQKKVNNIPKSTVSFKILCDPS